MRVKGGDSQNGDGQILPRWENLNQQTKRKRIKKIHMGAAKQAREGIEPQRERKLCRFLVTKKTIQI